MQKQPFEIDAAMVRIRDAVRPFPKAAMFELRDDGFDSPFAQLVFIARTGLQWRYLPHDLPAWQAVYQQTRRWIAADVFTMILTDLRELIRIGDGRSGSAQRDHPRQSHPPKYARKRRSGGLGWRQAPQGQ